MSHAAKTLTNELAYLRSMHEEATTQGNTQVANDIASDIADVVSALDALDPKP